MNLKGDQGLASRIFRGIRELDEEGRALHPHQRRRLVFFGLCVLLATLSVGYQLSRPDAEHRQSALAVVGARALSADALRATVQKAKIAWAPYWIGERAGCEYTLRIRSDEEIAVEYIAKNSSHTIATINIYAVETYKSSQAYDEEMKAEVVSALSETRTALGRTIHYATDSMKYMQVDIPGSTSLIRISTAKKQSLPQLMALADLLKPLG